MANDNDKDEMEQKDSEKSETNKSEQSETPSGETSLVSEDLSDIGDVSDKNTVDAENTAEEEPITDSNETDTISITEVADNSDSSQKSEEQEIVASDKQTLEKDAHSTKAPVVPEVVDDFIDDEDEEDITVVKASDIESQITNLIATGRMFQAHTMAKKAFQKNPDNVGVAQAYALVLLKTGAIDESHKLIYSILGAQPQLDESTGTMMITLEDLKASSFLTEAPTEIVANVGLIFKESWKYTHNCRDLEIARELIALGKIKENFLKDGISEFVKRLTPYTSFEIVATFWVGSFFP